MMLAVLANPLKADNAIEPISVGGAKRLRQVRLNLKPLTGGETKWFFKVHVEDEEEPDPIPYGQRMMSSQYDKDEGVILLTSVTFQPEEQTIKRVKTVCQAKQSLPLVGCQVEWAVEDEPMTLTHEMIVINRVATYRDFLDEAAPKAGKKMSWNGSTVMMSALVRLICLLPHDAGKVYHVGRVMMSRMEEETIQYFLRCEGKDKTTKLTRFTLWRGPELFQEYFINDKNELQRAASSWNDGARMVMQRMPSKDASAMQLAMKKATEIKQPAKDPQPAAKPDRNLPARDDITAENSVEDDEHKIVLIKHSRGLELRVNDLKGQILFSGPYNTAADRDKVPEKFRDKIREYGLEDFEN